ncbi:hypothetical protein WCX72_09825 [Sulfurimonas sp. HSL1-6]|uniref:hypothetical protein n=1 Tax=Thiomicrolovo immobilis TaxID=3131935 RepID=UPI0031F7FB1E
MKPLYLTCPSDQFAAAPCSEEHTTNTAAVKLEARNCKVWLNDAGRCSVQQFGTARQARAKYEQIKKEIGWSKS